MKWIKIKQKFPPEVEEQFPGRGEPKHVYIPETAVQEVIFFKDRVVVDTEYASYTHYYRFLDEDGRCRAEEDFILFLTASQKLGPNASEITLIDLSGF